jgi:biopolymer transport protein ExbD
MKFSKSRHELKKGEMDIAPFLNVFFVILIFFIFSSSFIFQPGIRVNLPRAVTGEVVAQESIVMTITKENLVYLKERLINQEELASNLKMLAKEKMPLLIKADRNSSLGKIVEILDLCRQEGLSQVSMATIQEVR